MKNGTIQFLSSGNSQVRVWRSDTKHKKKFVVFPDPPNLIEHHSFVLDQLSKKYNVVCIELPGFGYSKVKAGFTYSMEEYVAILSFVFDTYKLKNVQAEVSCLGALIILHMAQASPHYFNKLYLLQCCSIGESKNWLNTVDLLNSARTKTHNSLI